VVRGIVQVSIPATMSKEEEAHWVSEMLGRIERQRQCDGIDLAERAAALAARYRLSTPLTIRWSDNQEWRWGSCTPADRSIRISSRLAKEPGWVLDYVLVHELAHLDVSGHGPRFWNLVHRYPRTERAKGFLIARALEPEAQPADQLEPGCDGYGSRLTEGAPRASRSSRQRRVTPGAGQSPLPGLECPAGNAPAGLAV